MSVFLVAEPVRRGVRGVRGVRGAGGEAGARGGSRLAPGARRADIMRFISRRHLIWDILKIDDQIPDAGGAVREH